MSQIPLGKISSCYCTKCRLKSEGFSAESIVRPSIFFSIFFLGQGLPAIERSATLFRFCVLSFLGIVRMPYQPIPRRWRRSLEEIPPSFLYRDRERSIIAKNFLFVLRETVSTSALRRGTTAATGFPFLTTTIGFFFASRAYWDNGPDAFAISTFFIFLPMARNAPTGRSGI